MSVHEEDPFGGAEFQAEPASPAPLGICHFCRTYYNPDDPDLYREVVSWVHGPKLDGPVLREQTGNVGHGECVRKVKAGQAPDQEKLL